MKLRKILFAAMPAIITIAPLTTTISCSKDGLPKVKDFETRHAYLHVLQTDSSGKPYYVISPYGYVDVAHFNESEVGYINVDDYVNTVMKLSDIYGEDQVNYLSVTKDKKTTITNLTHKATATIDYVEQTITFSDYDAYNCTDAAWIGNPLAVGAGGGEKYFYEVKGKYFAPKDSYVIDLKKYDITAYYYEGKGYLPYDVFRNILNPSPITYLFYNGVNFYQVSTSNSKSTIDLYKPIREEATILTEEYMEYTYNLLALTLDHRFGLIDRPSRAEKGKMIKYLPDGAYKALEPYHDRLVSLNPNESNFAMLEFFNNECDDGGHAGYSGLNILSTAPQTTYRGPEKQHTFEVMDIMNDAREDAEYDMYSYWVVEQGMTEDAYNTLQPSNYVTIYESDKGEAPVMWITFDSFKSVNYLLTVKEIEQQKARYDDVTKNNYYLDTIRMTMYADKKLKSYNAEHESNPIKNVVIDIAKNGGGTVYTEHFLASWLCGGVTEKLYNPHTKAFQEYTVKADVNQDGKFNDDDYLSSDVNLYCITSDCSFSCGNMLPCNLVDNRETPDVATNHTFFIGGPSGGGACFVDGNMHAGSGNVFRSSSNYHMLKNNSTPDHPVTVESGCMPKLNWFIQIASTLEEANKFYDRDTILAEIRK